MNNPTPLSFFTDNRDTPSMTPVSMTLRLQYEALSQRVFYKVRSRLRGSKQQAVQSRSMHLYPRLVEPPIGRSELETLRSSIKIYNFVLLLFSIFWIDLTLQQKVTPLHFIPMRKNATTTSHRWAFATLILTSPPLLLLLGPKFRLHMAEPNAYMPNALGQSSGILPFSRINLALEFDIIYIRQCLNWMLVSQISSWYEYTFSVTLSIS